MRAPWTVAGASFLIFLLAFFSPVEMVDSDPAMALVAAQALLHHGTLDLGVYRDHPDFSYTFDIYNHRVEEIGGGFYYYSLGLPIATLPVVGAADLLGYDMLDQADEFAVQNLISALLTALIFVLSYRLARLYLTAGPSLLIALVSNLGSPLLSTHATAMWSSLFSTVLLAIVVLFLARRAEPLTFAATLGYGALLAAAFLIRPASAFLGIAFLLYLLGEKDRRLVMAARGALGLGALAFVLIAFELLPLVSRYYSPKKILPDDVPWQGLYGSLLGPSRGLLVWSPFLIPVAIGLVIQLRALLRDRILRLVLFWIAAHLVAVASKEVWWGGQCFGPRLASEVMPGFVVLSAWVLREVLQRLSTDSQARWGFVGSYLVLGLAAIFVHSFQGLFNPATLRWNVFPNVDDPRYHSLLLDWRYPQFLATDRMLEERFLDVQRRGFGPYRPGQTLGHQSSDLLFERWHFPEEQWRWTRGKSSALTFRLEDGDAGQDYAVDLYAGSLGPQKVALSWNDRRLADLDFQGQAPTHHLFVARSGFVRAGENTIRLEIPGARSTPRDPRVLGVAFRSLRLLPISEGLSISFNEDAYFSEGFSPAEPGWRWTDGVEARLFYPVAHVEASWTYELELIAGAFGDQEVEILLNGSSLGTSELRGAEPRMTRRSFPGSKLWPYRVHRIDFRLPRAAAPEPGLSGGDLRRLGLRFISLRISRREKSPARDLGSRS